VGIDKYKNPQMMLSYAREDAEAFVKSISQNPKGLFKEVVLHTLYDENATKRSILDTLKSLERQVSMNDVFVFYYAGHGGMMNDQFYFIPSECTRLYEDNALQKSAISASEVQDLLQKIKALKQIVIMDACHSGGAVEMISLRGSMEEKAMAQLSRSAGIHVLASAGTEQGAKEISSLQHGLFTYVLLKALEGEADGAPRDGKITIYELKSYLDDQVPELNRLQKGGRVQYPYTFSRGHDFPILLK
ncbi:MAG: caspase family protein, partial [Cytophagales bacterium]|nr:caspase family protein [Cytophagales bacterium]